ncbi:hypothetical protein EYZ11_013559 [Aspergillus tanneri]|uniref:Uncharacterized protein n=1 Tax=Aspergillus tanneri TaxID=1220188 RepID=A0A4S3IXD7_9EURO|nr:hypothetical protein EYZ11_013559 [Aspergillus tanneri]
MPAQNEPVTIRATTGLKRPSEYPNSKLGRRINSKISPEACSRSDVIYHIQGLRDT